MRLIDRYLLRELLIPLGYCLGGFLVFWISFDLFKSLNDFQRYNMQAGDIVHYYLLTAPELLVLLLPVALLLGLLYALTNHARHHELTAIRAAGVSLWRLSMPYLGTGLLFALVLFWLNEALVPDGTERAEQILLRRQTGQTQTPAKDWTRNLVFENELDQRHWQIGYYHVAAAVMRRPQIDCMNPDGSHRRIFAEGALWENGTWVLTNVEEVVYPAHTNLVLPPTHSATLVLSNLPETPELIASEIKISHLNSVKAVRQAQLSIRDLRHYLRLHPQLDAHRRNILLTMMHNRWATPWTCLVVVLIALPFGAPSGRRNVFVGVASSVFICFTFFVIRELALALGSGGYVTPWLAAWAPNLVFGGAGFFLTQRGR